VAARAAAAGHALVGETRRTGGGEEKKRKINKSGGTHTLEGELEGPRP
jgi:hypothetical protein